ncbi:YHS domain-containing (seleno)protein [Hyphococcus flavus]|uniref:YHS domain-containing (Seleno)protein n=1 Tax=Hyphococcus flavus TaxID=1866326 RepID=A0AAE9ZEC4_9PROT|nr:YHS domain-containing (seleno)protein [Hyphococcus flavus]WDI31522.1 YHS domain-containing (seleno)protein [Hyphococcus flavus]
MLRRILTLMTVLFAAFSLQGAMAESPVYTKLFSNLAVDGYDPVAYFTDGAPLKGKKQFSYEFNGAEWRFYSAENLEAFKSDPEAYAPQYGGYCAWAVSQNYIARGNPKNWSIVDGKLYLNYNNEIQSRWEQDIPSFIELANTNWPGVIDK